MSSAPCCPRNPRCIKGAGHAGWCKTVKGEAKDIDQGSLFAAAAKSESVKRSRPARAAGAGASKVQAMQELARKREKKQRGGRRAVVDDDDDEYVDDDDEAGDDDDAGDGDDDDWGGGGGGGGSRRSARSAQQHAGDGDVTYEDYGMSRAERRAARTAGRAEPDDDDDDDEAAATSAAEAAWASSPAAALSELESIRLKRQVLETWVLEPFFDGLVRRCLVRIGLQIPAVDGAPSTLYRVAEVVDVQEDAAHPYMIGPRRTTKYFLLNFGEAEQRYPMSSISNGAFEELELRSWQQVAEVAGLSPVSAEQVRARARRPRRAAATPTATAASLNPCPAPRPDPGGAGARQEPGAAPGGQLRVLGRGRDQARAGGAGGAQAERRRAHHAPEAARAARRRRRGRRGRLRRGPRRQADEVPARRARQCLRQPRVRCVPAAHEEPERALRARRLASRPPVSG